MYADRPWWVIDYRTEGCALIVNKFIKRMIFNLSWPILKKNDKGIQNIIDEFKQDNLNKVDNIYA